MVAQQALRQDGTVQCAKSEQKTCSHRAHKAGSSPLDGAYHEERTPETAWYMLFWNLLAICSSLSRH